ncbi:MAG: class II aldolase/adducin family protein [Myxococcaceae bacterium]
MSDLSELRMREEVVRFCRLLHERNYLAANDGNVSVRLDAERLLVTPTGVYKAFIEPEDLVVVDLEGRQLSGKQAPTGELPMHLCALRNRPEIQAAVHSHPPTAIAMSLHPGLLGRDVLGEVILSIGRFELVPYARPQTEDMARALEPVVKRSDAMILERHGTLTLGRTLLDAYALTERLEHAALILWRAHAIGTPTALPEDEARALRDIHARTRSQSR